MSQLKPTNQSATLPTYIQKSPVTILKESSSKSKFILSSPPRRSNFTTEFSSRTDEAYLWENSLSTSVVDKVGVYVKYKALFGCKKKKSISREKG